MDGPVLDQIHASDNFPQQAVSLSQNPICTNCEESELAGELKVEVDAVDPLGAGANAVSETTMIINVATNPLSELVWSPHKGLTLKYTDCSLLEEKSSILWSTDLANMIVMTSECVEGRLEENVNDNVATDEALVVAPPRTISSLSGKTLAEKNLAQASDKDVESISFCNLRIDESSSGLTRQVQCAETKSAVHFDLNDNLISTGETKVEKNIFGNETGVNGGSVDKNSASGMHTCGAINFCKQDQPSAINLSLPSSESHENKNVVCVEKPMLDPCPGESSMLGNINPPLDESSRSEVDIQGTSKQARKDEIDLMKTDVCNAYDMMIAKSPPSQRKVGDESSSDKGLRMKEGSHGSVESSNSGDGYASKKRTWTSKQARKDEIDLMKTDVCNAYDMMIAKSPPSQRKVGDESSSDKGLRMKEGSHGSVESSNSGDGYASKKRTWISDQTCFEANKKMKKQNDSFMNWLYSVANGCPKIRKDEKPLLAVPVSSSQLFSGVHESYRLPVSDRQKSSDRGTGFGKFFEALYNQASSREGINESEQLVSSRIDNSYIANAKCKLDMPKKIPIEHFQCSNNSKNVKFFVGEASSSDNKIIALSNEGKSSSSSPLKDDNSLHDVKVINRNNFAFPDTLVNSTDGGDRRQNMWISRFRSNVSNPEESDMNIPMNNLICSYGHLSPSEVKDNVEGTSEPSSEDQEIALCKKLPECDAESSGLKPAHGDQKCKAKIHPIMPSKKFRSSDDISSIFARRLDALKHITSSKVRGGKETNTICLFCGMRDHTLRDCSEIDESELEDLLSNFNSCGDEEDASCLCIRCFSLTHWANSCPYTLLKQPVCDHEVGFKTCPISGPRVMSSIGNKDEAPQPSHSCPIIQGESSGVGYKFLCSSNDEKTLGNIVPTDIQTSSMKVHELINGWKASLCFSENTTPVPNNLFQTIGKLHLSRSELLRWISLPRADTNLEGLFLRVRLGKWVEGLGAIGYHVARIVGTHQNKPFGSSNHSMYVDLGGFKCPINIRLVSNHNFTEEELKVWWCANIRGDRTLPTEEELNARLSQKEKQGI